MSPVPAEIFLCCRAFAVGLDRRRRAVSGECYFSVLKWFTVKRALAHIDLFYYSSFITNRSCGRGRSWRKMDFKVAKSSFSATDNWCIMGHVKWWGSDAVHCLLASATVAKSTQNYNLRRCCHSFSLTQKQSSYELTMTVISLPACYFTISTDWTISQRYRVYHCSTVRRVIRDY